MSRHKIESEARQLPHFLSLFSFSLSALSIPTNFTLDTFIYAEMFSSLNNSFHNLGVNDDVDLGVFMQFLCCTWMQKSLWAPHD